MKTVIVLASDRMGEGDDALGARLLKTFLQKSIALRGLDAILLYNSGVRLCAAGSPVLGELVQLEENGVDLVPCGTCLEAYGVEPRIGAVGSMDGIVKAMDDAEKVLRI